MSVAAARCRAQSAHCPRQMAPRIASGRAVPDRRAGCSRFRSALTLYSVMLKQMLIDRAAGFRARRSSRRSAPWSTARFISSASRRATNSTEHRAMMMITEIRRIRARRWQQRRAAQRIAPAKQHHRLLQPTRTASSLRSGRAARSNGGARSVGDTQTGTQSGALCLFRRCGAPTARAELANNKATRQLQMI